MEAMRAILSRRSIRRYKKRSISEEVPETYHPSVEQAPVSNSRMRSV